MCTVLYQGCTFCYDFIAKCSQISSASRGTEIRVPAKEKKARSKSIGPRDKTVAMSSKICAAVAAERLLKKQKMVN